MLCLFDPETFAFELACELAAAVGFASETADSKVFASRALSILNPIASIRSQNSM